MSTNWLTMTPDQFDRDADAGEQLAMIPTPDPYGTPDLLDAAGPDEEKPARRPILCAVDGNDLTTSVRWEFHGHAFCSMAEMEAWENAEDE